MPVRIWVTRVESGAETLEQWTGAAEAPAATQELTGGEGERSEWHICDQRPFQFPGVTWKEAFLYNRVNLINLETVKRKIHC